MEAFAGAVSGGAQFTQLVERTDGASDVYPVGAAVYHAGHNHFHIANFVVNTLYEYDAANHARGPMVGAGHKDGFCPIDERLDELGLLDTQEPVAAACQVTGGDITIRLEPNYIDVYPASIDDQEVDITNVPPGTYVLVTRVDPEGAVLESDASNNEARVLVQIDASGARAIPGDAP
jgi:hypothetical protein